ncbi:hypothetical protein FHG87_020515, partial [Trinorchestia longiramus]
GNKSPTSDQDVVQANNVGSPGIHVPLYRKIAEDEISDWHPRRRKTISASSTSEIGSVYETSCSSTTCSSSPYLAQPSDVADGEIVQEQEERGPLVVPSVTINEVMDTIDGLGNALQVDTNCGHPVIYKLPSVSTVSHLLSPETAAKIGSPHDSGLGSSTDGSPARPDSNQS